MIYLKKMADMVIVDCVKEDDNKRLSGFIRDELCEPNINSHGFSNLDLLEFTTKLDK